MPASKNILGPDPARGATASRPSKSTAPNATPHWFNVCSDPNDPNQTKLTADCFNDLIGTLRESVGSSGADQQEAAVDSDKMISEAMARYASGGCNGVCTGAANTYAIASAGLFIVPKSLFDGMIVITEPSATNTGASTAAVFGLAAKAVRTFDDRAMIGGELLVGVPTMWKYKAAANAGAGAWLVLPWSMSALDRLPIFPEMDTVGNVFGVSGGSGSIIVTASQQFRHRAHRVINTTDTLLASRTFATLANKTYHLRWTWANGVGTYSLFDVTALTETDEIYDSTYDMMLIGKVVTNGSNVFTFTALANKNDLSARGELLFTGVAWDGDLVAPSALTSGTTTTLNWARRPQVALNMFTSVSTKHGSDTLSVQQLNVGNLSKSRYTFFTTYQKTELPQTGYVAYEAFA